jgi:hypothetical protein
MTKKRKRPSLIYFAQARGGRVDGLVKVGCTHNVAERLRSVGNKNKTSMQLLATAFALPNEAYILERYAHNILTSYLAYEREWFYPSSQVFWLATECTLDHGFLENFYPSQLPCLQDIASREQRLVAADHEAVAFAHYKRRTYEAPSIYRPMRAASLKLAADLTIALLAPSNVIALSTAPALARQQSTEVAA